MNLAIDFERFSIRHKLFHLPQSAFCVRRVKSLLLHHKIKTRMDTLLNLALIFHIIGGSVALLTGSVSMFSKKGGNIHKRFGKIFFYSMMIVSFSALFLSVLKSNLFLTLVGIFVFYQTYSGLRAIRNKTLRHNLLDGAIIFAAFMNGVVMFFTLNPVLIVFGCITLLLISTEVRTFLANRKNKALPRLTWLTKHIGMMVGSYIGTLTAFLVVNIYFEPGWILWLAPTAVLVPLMQYWNWKYTKRPLQRLQY